MNDHHVLQHLALLLLIIPALAITNPPYSSPNVPFIETGITNIITAAKGAGCGSWKGTTAPIVFLAAKSDVNYDILLSLQNFNDGRGLIRFMKYVFTKTTSKVDVKWMTQYNSDVCNINHLSYRYAIKRS